MSVLISIIIFLVLAFLLALIEGNGGYLGDSSMIPGLLIFGTIITILIAFLTGHIIIK